jgi:nucleoside-diphosphate-sugar epimerase
VLIVGCGCRGRELATALVASGHAVRGTTRSAGSLDAIRATGAEPVVADPDRLGTVMVQLAGVSVVCWLLATAADPALHGPRLETLLERLVDTPVRGFVYEAGGGEAAVGAASERWRIPAEVVEQDPADHAVWLSEMKAAVGRLL